MEKKEIKEIIKNLFLSCGEKNIKKKNIDFLYKVIKNIVKNIKNVKTKPELFKILEENNEKFYLILLDFEKLKKGFEKFSN